MSKQDILSLFGDDDGLQFPVQATSASRMKGTTETKFEAFHTLNPHVHDAIVKIARDLKGRGFARCSIWLIFNRLRWLYALQTQGDEFKLNNNYTAYYARLVMATTPDLNGFFETRVLKGHTPYVPDLVALGFTDT